MNIGELRTGCCCVMCADTNCAVHVLCGVLLCMKIVTVNCARIIHGNQVATNGVVHVIDRVITGVSNTIQDVIEVDDDLTTLSVSFIFFCSPLLLSSSPFISIPFTSFPTFFFIMVLLLSPFPFSSFCFHSIRFTQGGTHSINGGYDGGYNVFFHYRMWPWPQACWTSWDSPASTPCLPPPTMPSPSWTRMCCND